MTADAFLSGAEAMRARILAGIRRWWDAPRSRRYRPAHPHWLEVAIARIDARELLAGGGAAGGDGGADAGFVDPKGRGELHDGRAARDGESVDQPRDCVGAQVGILTPPGELPESDHVTQQVAEGFGVASFGHGGRCSGSDGKNLAAALDKGDETDENDDMAEGDPGHYPQETAPPAASLGGSTASEAHPEPKSETMNTLPLHYSRSQQPSITGPQCPPEFIRACGGYEGVRVDRQGYSVWVLVVTEGRGPRAKQHTDIHSEPVLTDAADFEANYDLPPTPFNVAMIAERESDAIEEAALEQARQTWQEGFIP